MKKILIALGGNALGSTPTEQKESVKITASSIVDLFEDGYKIAIVHGNGPQVGMINNAFGALEKQNSKVETMPFAECSSMSQGYIGFHLQNAIKNELMSRSINATAATIISQMIVDKNDSAFNNPTKPIGPFMDEAIAKKLASENNWVVKEDAGRGWRRVVPSPKPLNLVEKNLLKNIFDLKDTITIVGGGGGIPVYEENNKLIGIDSVIDKDFTAAKIAELLDVDSFVILTAVDNVYIRYNTPDQKKLENVTLDELNGYIESKEFAAGSMLPKVQATISFTKATGKDSYITGLKNLVKALASKGGTKISK